MGTQRVNQSQDEAAMRRALELAGAVRAITSPNPWVGAVLATAHGWFEGATSPPGGPHAEIVALQAAREAGVDPAGATLYSTLEPCAHLGRTPPCADAIIEAGVTRVVVAIEDPDPKVAGAGLARLHAAGLEVGAGMLGAQAEEQLAPYLKHRRTGRPWVVLKLAATLDGRTAAPDGSSRWITGEAARRDAHRLRAESDAVLVGAGTVAVDDPQLTARPSHEGPPGPDAAGRQPLRVVLGHAPPHARVQPALELTGELGGVLDELGRRGVLQVLVEGGATVAGAFHRAGLIDRWVIYLAPALLGGDDGRPLFAGAGAPTLAEGWRGQVLSMRRLGPDIRLDLAAAPHLHAEPAGAAPRASTTAGMDGSGRAVGQRAG
ncbi:MAG: bifunctional diaminohydroxyphosphoribosylaminopyrimidine deaminase/5-amino-6-(5-phosphoribosylamino)uracil reductase RibD [Acidimicrobiales bacterium]